YRAGGGRSTFHGDYTDSPATPLFPFGHGLGYTTLAYDELAVRGTSTSEPVEVSVRVANDGVHAGDEVIQLYVRDEVASVARPNRQLVGFAWVSLAPGERHTVHFTVHPSRLAFYDPQMRFVNEPGVLTFMVGASSADIRGSASVDREVNGFYGLVNNAAVVPLKPIAEYTLEEYERIQRVNAHAAFALVQALAPSMRARGGGAVVNVCSITLGGEWANFVPYVASKGALLGMTRALARELGPDNIRVNAVSPGAI